MNNCKIGIKLADGSFYPILEEGAPQSKIIELTTVRDDQTTVQLDLYRSSSDDMEDAEYVDTLLVENLLPRPKETPTLNLKIEIDAENVLSASIEDCESGESSETKVSLVNLDSSDRTIVPDFSMIDAETADNEEVDSLLDEFADNTIAVPGEATMENELSNNDDLNLDDFGDVNELLSDDVENQDDNLPELDDLSEIQEEPVLDEMPEIADDSELDEFSEVTNEPELDEMPEIAEEPELDEFPEVTEEPVMDDLSEIQEQSTFDDFSENSTPEEFATEDTFAEVENDSEIENGFVAEEPILDEMPEIAEEPVLDEMPEFTEEPELDEMPEISEEPALDEMPEISEEPELDEMPEFTEEPVLDEMPEIADEPVLDEMPSIDVDYSSESTDIMQDSILDSSDFSESSNENLDLMEEEFPDFSDIPTASENEIADTDLDSNDDDGFFGIGNDYGDLNTDMDFDEDDAFASNIDTSTDLDESIPSPDLSFSDLYVDTTENDCPEKKRCSIPVLICSLCAVICVIVLLLILFLTPSKLKNKEENSETSIWQEETTVQEVVPAPVETITEELPEQPEVVVEEEAKEDEIVIVEAPVVTPVEPEPVQEKLKGVEYKIKWGDTLWDIAGTYYKNPWLYREIAKYNGLENPDYIVSGTIITIPPR